MESVFQYRTKTPFLRDWEPKDYFQMTIPRHGDLVFRNDLKINCPSLDIIDRIKNRLDINRSLRQSLLQMGQLRIFLLQGEELIKPSERALIFRVSRFQPGPPPEWLPLPADIFRLCLEFLTPELKIAGLSRDLTSDPLQIASFAFDQGITLTAPWPAWSIEQKSVSRSWNRRPVKPFLGSE